MTSMIRSFTEISILLVSLTVTSADAEVLGYRGPPPVDASTNPKECVKPLPDLKTTPAEEGQAIARFYFTFRGQTSNDPWISPYFAASFGGI
jgi:hypothetical protein